MLEASRNTSAGEALALREIFAGTAAATGEQFFDALVKHLARAMGTTCAWVTEWSEDRRRLRALSFWADGRYVQDYEYDIRGTPCEPVLDTRSLVLVPDRVIELYPKDPDLAPLGAVSYMGMPLVDTDGRALGHLAILDDKPMPESPTATTIFSIFAARAAAELGRLRRDRELREREEKLSRLVETAMDAILELDAGLAVTKMNGSGERAFACPGAAATGQRLDRFFSRVSCGRLVHLTGELGRRPQGRQSLWIPDRLEALRADGSTFPAEATLSRYEVGGRPFFTLILRNIDDRLDAEQRIRALAEETAYLRAEIDSLQGFDEIVGESDALLRMLADVDRVAGTDATVLITGETGTGKELIARAIHRRSARQAKPLIRVNCAAIAATLQESEFFGHEKGAFTGALQRRDGRFKLADGGTIFLDEVGEMPLDLQAKLLRVLQEGEFERVGSARTETVDVRVVTATNRDLKGMVREGTFRQDLLYRLNVFPVHVPALRERGGDVVLLAEAFACRFARQRGTAVAPLTETDKARLRRYDWPGNVRELENVIERALITSTDGRTLNLARALPEADGAGGAPPATETTPAAQPAPILTVAELEALERANFLRALEHTGWKLSGAGGAAQLLGLHPNTLASRMKARGIERPRRP